MMLLRIVHIQNQKIRACLVDEYIFPLLMWYLINPLARHKKSVVLAWSPLLALLSFHEKGELTIAVTCKREKSRHRKLQYVEF